MPEEFELLMTPNGSLQSTAPWVTWTPGSGRIVLDGDFSLDELRSIIRQVEARLAGTAANGGPAR